MRAHGFILAASLIFAVALVAGCTSNPANNNTTTQGSVKEFNMDSFYTIENGKPYQQYSLNEIIVNKGDIVIINVNTTKGTHDLNIDELNVHAATPTGKVTPVQFIADKSGEFVYYCAMPGHRENGQWGTLKVLEK